MQFGCIDFIEKVIISHSQTLIFSYSKFMKCLKLSSIVPLCTYTILLSFFNFSNDRARQHHLCVNIQKLELFSQRTGVCEFLKHRNKFLTSEWFRSSCKQYIDRNKFFIFTFVKVHSARVKVLYFFIVFLWFMQLGKLFTSFLTFILCFTSDLD